MNVINQVHIGKTDYLRIPAAAKRTLGIDPTTQFDMYCTADSMVFKLRSKGLSDCILPVVKFSHYAETVITLLADNKRIFKPTLLNEFKAKHKRNAKSLLMGAISELVACNYLTEKSMRDTYIWRNEEPWIVPPVIKKWKKSIIHRHHIYIVKRVTTVIVYR